MNHAMNPAMNHASKTPARHVLYAAALLALSACGGDDGDSEPGPEPPPPTMTLQGQVTRNAALENAAVCLDLNGNDACDDGEPASAPTGADGRYSVTATPEQADAARLIAVVKANATVDAAQPGEVVSTGSGYVLKRPAGSSGGINPLTTLVQAGVAAGMTQAQARDAVAAQLGIAAAKIDDYQDDPPTDDGKVEDTARWIASFTSVALREGVPLQVADPSAAGGASDVMDNLIWRDADNFYWRSLRAAERAAGVPTATVADLRAGRIGGADRPDYGAADSLYRTAYLGPSGWQLCGRNAPAITSTGGNPSRSVFCGASSAVSFNRFAPVAGEAMSALVARWRNDPGSNRINNDGTPTAGLTAALGSAVFPPGAQEMRRTGLTLSSDIVIDNTWSRGLAQSRGTTLAEMVMNHPVGSVNLADGTSAAGTTISLGLGRAVDKNLRVAFGPGAGEAQFYECDLDAQGVSFAVPPNCVATTAGSYAIETLHGASVMRFAGHPPVVATIGYEVVYTEIDWGGGPGNRWVYRAHASRPDLSWRSARSMRLDGTAWGALKTQLGL